MTTRIDGSAPSVVMSDVDLVAEFMVKLNQDNERANRESLRDEREIATAAGELRLGQMKEAAEFRLAAGIVSGACKIGSSVAGGVAAATRGPGSTDDSSSDGTSASESAAASTPEGGAEGAAGGAAEGAAASSSTAHDRTASDWAKATGGVLDGAGPGAAALMERFASDADMRAEQAKMAMDRATSRADERRADADEAGRRVDSLHDALKNVLSEKRRAEEAATRA